MGLLPQKPLRRKTPLRGLPSRNPPLGLLQGLPPQKAFKGLLAWDSYPVEFDGIKSNRDSYPRDSPIRILRDKYSYENIYSVYPRSKVRSRG